jgi:hypothetical protein
MHWIHFGENRKSNQEWTISIRTLTFYSLLKCKVNEKTLNVYVVPRNQIYVVMSLQNFVFSCNRLEINCIVFWNKMLMFLSICSVILYWSTCCIVRIQSRSFKVESLIMTCDVQKCSFADVNFGFNVICICTLIVHYSCVSQLSKGPGGSMSLGSWITKQLIQAYHQYGMGSHSAL